MESDKLNILFYGTCQALAIKEILNLSNDKYIQHHIQCYSTEYTKKEIDEILNKCDIIITQPIPDYYRDVIYLSTSYLISNCKKNCNIIIYQRQYFDFYYFDTTYYEFNGDTLHEPNDYHYKSMINYYKNGKSCNDYINEIVDNNLLKNKNELDDIANNSIKYLIDKDIEIINKYFDTKLCDKNKKCRNLHYIPVVDYIKDNYRNRLLFYSMNHPTKILLQYIAENIINILDIENTINYNIDPLDNPRCILYSCIKNAVNFDISYDKNNIILGDKEKINDIVGLYYDTYNKIKL